MMLSESDEIEPKFCWVTEPGGVKRLYQEPAPAWPAVMSIRTSSPSTAGIVLMVTGSSATALSVESTARTLGGPVAGRARSSVIGVTGMGGVVRVAATVGAPVRGAARKVAAGMAGVVRVAATAGAPVAGAARSSVCSRFRPCQAEDEALAFRNPGHKGLALKAGDREGDVVAPLARRPCVAGRKRHRLLRGVHYREGVERTVVRADKVGAKVESAIIVDRDVGAATSAAEQGVAEAQPCRCVIGRAEAELAIDQHAGDGAGCDAPDGRRGAGLDQHLAVYEQPSIVQVRQCEQGTCRREVVADRPVVVALAVRGPDADGAGADLDIGRREGQLTAIRVEGGAGREVADHGVGGRGVPGGRRHRDRRNGRPDRSADSVSGVVGKDGGCQSR